MQYDTTRDRVAVVENTPTKVKERTKMIMVINNAIKW